MAVINEDNANYVPTTTGGSLVVALSDGSCIVNGVEVPYAGGDVTCDASEKNYIYLDGNTGVPDVATGGFPLGAQAIAVAETSALRVERLLDVRPASFSPLGITAASSFAFSSVPASAAAVGVAGQMAKADGYLYVCIASGQWQRAVLATW